MAGLSRRFLEARSRLQLPSLPEKWKGGRIERWANFWKNLAIDYKEAGMDIVQSAKDKPLKAAVYSSLGLSALYFNRHLPTEHNFYANYIDMNNEMAIVPLSISNPAALERSRQVVRLRNEQLLRYQSFGVFSVMWIDDFASTVGLFQAQCKYLKPGYLEMFDRVFDVGFNGRWLMSERDMADFDINPKEWDSEGRPTAGNEQWK